MFSLVVRNRQSKCSTHNMILKVAAFFFLKKRDIHVLGSSRVEGDPKAAIQVINLDSKSSLARNFLHSYKDFISNNSFERLFAFIIQENLIQLTCTHLQTCNVLLRSFVCFNFQN